MIRLCDHDIGHLRAFYLSMRLPPSQRYRRAGRTGIPRSINRNIFLVSGRLRIMDIPRLSIIVPVYNEERTIAAVMDRIVIACGAIAEVIYIDDGSKDGSLAILKAKARAQDTVLTKPNGGKGDAVRMGITKARAPFIVIQDADLEYEPAEILHLLEVAEHHPGAVVFGSRFLRSNPNIYRRFLWGNKVLSAAVSLLFFRRITDSYTCYKLLPSPLFRSLEIRSTGFEMEAEICSKCLRRGIPILEVPISYRPRSLAEGKKIRFADAWKGLLMMILVRFGSR